MKKENLIKIYKETEKCIQNGFYLNGSGEEIEFDVRKLKTGSIFYDTTEPVQSKKAYNSTKIYVENTDSFLKAIEFGPSGAVLNMASSRYPGGGVTRGSRAQEEDLCRRSNLTLSLYSYSSLGYGIYGFTKRTGEYPIPTYGGIYSPAVSIFRNAGNYGFLPEPIMTNVITVSAIARPRLTPDGTRLEKSLAQVTKRKIRTILRIAILGGHSKLVLGAFGCGAYSNPPRHMAELFKSVLSEEEFCHAFEEICFAILDDGNTGKSHNPEGNFKPFVDVFGTL